MYGLLVRKVWKSLFVLVVWSNPIRNVVGWYKMSYMVYFEFWLSWFWFGRKFSVKNAKLGNFCILLDTLTPKRGAPPRRRSLRLGEPKPRFSTLSYPPRRSSASPRQTSPPRRSIASLRHTCKLCFGSSISLILTIIH